MKKELLNKSAKEILEGYEDMQKRIEELERRNQFWKDRCEKLEENLRIFSSPDISVNDFINE